LNGKRVWTGKTKTVHQKKHQLQPARFHLHDPLNQFGFYPYAQSVHQVSFHEKSKLTNIIYMISFFPSEPNHIAATFQSRSDEPEKFSLPKSLMALTLLLIMILYNPVLSFGGKNPCVNYMVKKVAIAEIPPDDKSSRDCDPTQKAAPDAVNIIPNGYFESDYNGWFTLGSPTLSLTETTYASGCKSLMISNRTATLEAAAMDVTTLLDENQIYRFVVWARCSSLNSTSLNITLKIQFSKFTP
jgi:hypothetical protein